MDDLIRVLEKTLSSSQADQNEAVRFVQDFTQRDFTGFLKALSDVLYNQQNPPVVRAAAGLQLKNQLTARDENLRHQQQDRWRVLPEETRQYIKERVFRTLGTELIRPSSAPQCIAYIAVVELPEQQWPGLLPALTHNVTNPASTSQMRLASLEAIGYICRDIDGSILNQLNSDSSLTNAVIQGMKDEETDEVQLAATNALLNILDHSLKQISRTHQSIAFEDLGRLLKIERKYAERIVAQMLRENKVSGYLDQVREVVNFESKDVMQAFDDDILGLCSEVNNIIEGIKDVVHEDWWAANARQRC